MASNFKFKEKKKIAKKSERTLDYKHEKSINNIENEKMNLDKKKKELTKLLLEKKKIDSQSNIDISNELIKKNVELDITIKNLENDIKNIEENNSELNYFFDTANILFEYYDIIEEQKNNLGCSNISNNSSHDNLKSIDSDNSSDTSFEEPSTNKNIFDFFTTEKKTNRADLLEDYMHITDNSFISKKKLLNTKICSKCNIEMTLIQSEAIVVCTKCGSTEFILVDSEKPSFREPVPENSYFAYKRINHFNEWLAQFQAKESTEIPEKVYDLIKIELKKCRITNYKELTSVKIRAILKKLKLNKYYEHIAHIINKLNGVPPPTINRETEEKLRSLFKQIQGPFEECCPPNRKNFLSYSYVLHKFTELLHLHQYKNHFKLLKSREKLLQQDKIWNCICNKLGWEFIPSI